MYIRTIVVRVSIENYKCCVVALFLSCEPRALIETKESINLLENK